VRIAERSCIRLSWWIKILHSDRSTTISDIIRLPPSNGMSVSHGTAGEFSAAEISDRRALSGWYSTDMDVLLL